MNTLKAETAMNSTEALREFAEDMFPLLREETAFNIVRRDLQGQCIEKLTALISEHYYPKEFVEWIVKQTDMVRLIRSPKGYEFINLDEKEDAKIVKIITKDMDELFNYWKENEAAIKSTER